MPSAVKLFLFLGSILAGLSVVLGAFGAHGLKGKLAEDLMAVYQTAVQYQFYHALGLIAVGLVLAHLPHACLLKWSGGLMLMGILVFSGSLFLMCLTGQRWLGAITPLGGVAFILSWVIMAIAVLRG